MSRDLHSLCDQGQAQGQARETVRVGVQGINCFRTFSVALKYIDACLLIHGRCRKAGNRTCFCDADRRVRRHQRTDAVPRLLRYLSASAVPEPQACSTSKSLTAAIGPQLWPWAKLRPHT